MKEKSVLSTKNRFKSKGFERFIIYLYFYTSYDTMSVQMLQNLSLSIITF